MSTSPWRKPALATSVATVAAVLLALLGPSTAEAADPFTAASPWHHGHQVIVRILPGISQPGAVPAPSALSRRVVEVQLQPPAPRRRVVLEQHTPTGWQQVASGTAARTGLVDLWAPQTGTPVYRAIAQPWKGLGATTSARVRDTWGAPDFVDEFDGAALGPAWENRVQFYNPWGGRACSKGDPAAVAVSGGALQLSSILDPAATSPCSAVDQKGNALGDFPYRLNGHISTQHAADFLYGVAAARMRFPRSLGQHGAFWLQPRGLLETGTTPWGAEVDVVEWYGQGAKNDVMASAVHEPLPDGSKRQIGGRIHDPARFLATRSDTWWNRFHVFSVEWTPAEYIFRIGAHEVWRTSQGVSDVPEFLILSMLSSDFELPGVGTDPTPRTLEVDWVAFWQGETA